MWNPSLLSLVLLNFKKLYTATFFFFFCLQHTLLSWSSDGPHLGVSFVETGSMSLSLVSSTECRINFINWESIELTRKFVQVFLQPLMEKPKWTFGQPNILDWLNPTCSWRLLVTPAFFPEWMYVGVIFPGILPIFRLGSWYSRWIAVAGFSAFALYPSPHYSVQRRLIHETCTNTLFWMASVNGVPW